MRRAMIGAGLALAVGLAFPATAQPRQNPNSLPNRSDYTLEVLDNLRHETVWRERRPVEGEGHLLYFAELSLVAPGDNRVVSITGAGTPGPITVIGFCDLDCRDLQLEILDQDSRVLAVSEARGRAPEVTFYRDGVTTYYARVSAPRCDAAYCFYTLGALQAE